MSNSSHLSWRSDKPELPLEAALAALGFNLREIESQEWDPETSTFGGIRDYKLCSIEPKSDDWSFLLLHANSPIGNSLALELSTLTSKPAIVFHEYDQTAWGFNLYDKGQLVGKFCNSPRFIDEEPSLWLVDAALVANCFGIEEKIVAPYLKHLGAGFDGGQKAHQDDKYSLSNHWVRCDFMARLGQTYPDLTSAACRRIYIG